MKSTLVKGIIITIVTLLATTVTTTGLPSTTTGWQILGITTAGTVLIYLAKNAVFPSTSILGNINIKDLISGVIMAVGSGLSSFAASSVTGTAIDWKHLLELAGGVAFGYIAKNFATGTSLTPVPTPVKPAA